jgi:hypothetical protein
MKLNEIPIASNNLGNNCTSPKLQITPIKTNYLGPFHFAYTVNKARGSHIIGFLLHLPAIDNPEIPMVLEFYHHTFRKPSNCRDYQEMSGFERRHILVQHRNPGPVGQVRVQ